MSSLKQYLLSKPFFLYLVEMRSWKNIEKNFKKYSDEEWLTIRFQKSPYKNGVKPNFGNPLTYDEKMLYIMFNDSDERKTICSDKVLVRDFVSSRGLSRILIEPFFVFDDANKIDYSKIDFPAMIKCNHTSGSMFFVDKGHQLSFWQKKCLNLSLKHNYYHVNRELNYKSIEPRIIVEKRLVNITNQPLLDYKFFCFDGAVSFVTIESGVSSKTGQHSLTYYRNFFTKNFDPLPEVTETRAKKPFLDFIKPDNWEDMINVSEKLSAGFNHVRVDLYSCNGQTFFGEMTFYHGAGNNNFQPESFEKEIALKLDVKQIKR